MASFNVLADDRRGLTVSDIPLIRLSTVTILLNFMDASGLSSEAVLEGVGLNRGAFEDSENVFVPALVIYQLCEDAAAAANDTTFLARLGESVDLADWEATAHAIATSEDLGQFLVKFAVDATEHSSAVLESLEIHGKQAVFHGHRSFAPSFVPGQIDGFYAGLLISLFRRTLGSAWNPHEVILTVSDPKALPHFFFGIKAIKGDRHGYRMAFPARWLQLPFNGSNAEERLAHGAPHGFPERTAAAAIAQALEVYVGEVPLTSKLAAHYCGKSERALSRLLEKEGTSLGEILSRLKRDYAVRMLSETDAPIVDIALALGYSAPTSFTRSFKEWVGTTPSEYRQGVPFCPST